MNITPRTTILNTIPQSPGVYIYKDASQTIIYIGKAINLKKRVSQYFQRDDAVGEKTPKLVADIASIETIQTTNEFEALLLEAKLIKEHQPKYNVIAKDDKSPLYILLDFRDELPRIRFARKPKQLPKHTEQEDQLTVYFGPFQSAKTARNLLRSLRKVVPYCTQKLRTGKPCFYTHLGLCKPCPSYIKQIQDEAEKKRQTKIYRKQIFRLRDILSGKAVGVIHDLEKDMNQAADNEHYEEAASLRNQIEALRMMLSKTYDPHMYTQSDTLVDELFQKEQIELLSILQPYFPHLTKLERIECYDISNIQGTNATASMVVMTQGRIDKNEYKKFKIKRENTPNDFAMMAEVLHRRLDHTEWQFPDVFVIDGGKGQVSAVLEVIQTHETTKQHTERIAVIGLAKREEEIIIRTASGWKTIRLPYSSGGLKLLQRLRDEAHRFAVRYHTFLRQKKSGVSV
jgi:excinuclease ABC subunit C